MSTVWVLTGDTTTDVAGGLMASGEVVGVFATRELAEAYLENEVVDSYCRRKNEYNIEEFKVEG